MDMPLMLVAGNGSDAAAVARLTYESDPPYYDFWLGNRSSALATLSALWLQPHGSYSAAENLLLRDHDGVAALVCSYPATAESRLAESSDSALRNVCGIAAEPLLMREAELSYLFPRLPENAWYLRSLAVAADRRGRGLGAQIVAHCAELARQQGCKQLLVDVDSGNPGAVRFYTSQGFEVMVETRVMRLLPHRLPASLRMAKLLNS